MASKLTLSDDDFFEASQSLDVIIEAGHAVHGVQHHHAGAEPTPAVGSGRPALRVRAVHAQPGFDAEFVRVASERLELIPQESKLLLGLRIRGQDGHPASAEPGGTP